MSRARWLRLVCLPGGRRLAARPIAVGRRLAMAGAVAVAGAFAAACAAPIPGFEDVPASPARIGADEPLAEPLDAVAWDPSGGRFLGLAGTGNLYDLSDPGVPSAVPTGLAGPTCLVIDANGVLWVGEAASRSVVSWRPGSGRRSVLSGSFDGQRFAVPTGLAFGGDRALWMTASRTPLEAEGRVSARPGLYRLTADGGVTRVAGDTLAAPAAVALSPDGRRLLVVDRAPEGVRLVAWTREPGGALREPRTLLEAGADDGRGTVAVLGEGPGPWRAGTVVVGRSGALLLCSADGRPEVRLTLPVAADGRVPTVRSLAVGGPYGRTVAVSVGSSSARAGRLLRVDLGRE